jgi:WD40 repeat protein
MELKKVKELNNLYPMSCLAVSDDESLLGCGLKEGTVAVWDLYTDSLKYTLDKHRGEITHLCFFEVYRLLSGSVGGEVHLDDLVTAHLIMKRTNTF